MFAKKEKRLAASPGMDRVNTYTLPKTFSIVVPMSTVTSSCPSYEAPTTNVSPSMSSEPAK